MEKNLPNAIFEDSFTVAGIEIKAYVLDDGRRILDMDGVNKLFAWMESGGEITEADAMELAQAKQGRTVMQRIPLTPEMRNE